MEIKNNVSNITKIKNTEDAQYLKNNTNTCNHKCMLFKYGLPEEAWLPEEVKNIIIDKYILLEIQLQRFLRLVAEGEQDQAEYMLQENLYLGTLSANVTDLSKRSFNNITGLQYAVWALDFHMWTMLLKYLKPADITKQLQVMEAGSWVAMHGKSASWQNLIDALDAYNKLCKQFKFDEADINMKLDKSVGIAQALLPAHVVNEYCHPTRSFYPCPDFKDAAPLPRSRQTDEGEWFTALYNGDDKATGEFAYLFWAEGMRADSSERDGFCDRLAIATLLATRLEQQRTLLDNYLGEKSQEQCKLK